jgi:hypothetical protein
MAAAIYVDKNGDSHVIDDPGAANPGVPPEALEALKKYKLCDFKYGDKTLTNDKLQEAINKDIKAAGADEEARKKWREADGKIKADAKADAEAAIKKIGKKCQDEIDAADKEMNGIIDAINAGNPPPGYGGLSKSVAKDKAHDARDAKVNGKGGIVERCKKKKTDAQTDSNTKAAGEIKKLGKEPPPPPEPPVSCAPNAACKNCDKGYIAPNPAYVPQPKKDDKKGDAPAESPEPKYTGHIAAISSLDKDHMYFCTCGLK